MSEPRIKVLAKSLGGSEHIIVGRVRNRQGVPYESKAEAREHLSSIGWTEIRFAVDEEAKNGIVRTVWSDQTITENREGSAAFVYITPKG